MLIRTRQSGDTLIEVMLAVVILSAVTLGGFSIMNKGLGISFGVLERTETRTLVSQQLELITYFRDQYSQGILLGTPVNTYPAQLWANIRAKANNTSVNATAPDDCQPSDRGFYVSQKPDSTYELLDYLVAKTPATTPTPGDGLWVEAVLPAAGNVGAPYIDFYVKTCWDAAVGSQKESLSSTMRLYDRL